MVLLVSLDLDTQVVVGVEDGLVCQGEQPDLVEGIGGVGNQLPEEDLLVSVE